jgi:hypothetical protein
MEPAPPVAGARGARILHAALVIGSILVGIVFFFVVRRNGPALGDVPLAGYLTAGLGLVELAFAIGFFRPRIPQRRMDQGPDEYWMTNEARGAAVLVWVMVEAAGLIAWVGYFLTGRAVPAAVAALALVTLITLRPSRLEGDGVS